MLFAFISYLDYTIILFSMFVSFLQQYTIYATTHPPTASILFRNTNQSNLSHSLNFQAWSTSLKDRANIDLERIEV